MSGNFQKEDLRVQRTCKALVSAMFSLLEHRSFRKITVNDLCNEALVSRAAFYAHFDDKYELLSHCLFDIRADMISRFKRTDTENVYSEIDAHINAHAKVLTNIVVDADAELMKIMNQASSPRDDASVRAKDDPNGILLDAFWSGGLINVFCCLASRDFPKEYHNITALLHKLHKGMMEWDKSTRCAQMPQLHKRAN
ncbi:MAG: TetR/AcrR family transcriptional regulator [Oscillospiraceae bacterium]|nr:TetR/AcrR family transcriptional regulator [Oscillospiraceae bacterium]